MRFCLLWFSVFRFIVFERNDESLKLIKFKNYNRLEI